MGRLALGVAALPIDCQNVPVLLTEWLTFAGREMSTTDYINGVKAGENQLRSTKMNTRAAMGWVVGNYEEAGHQSDISPHRDGIVNYVKTSRFQP